MQRNSFGSPARQLALSIDGVALVGADQPDLAYQAAFGALADHERQAFGALAQRKVVALGGLFDDVAAVLGVAGCAVASSDDGADPFARAQVVAIGCPHRSLRVNEVALHEFFARGGVLISSDKAALLPGLRELLPTVKPRGPRRARLAQPGAGTGGLLPAVQLDAGHAPLDPERLGPAANVLAYDALTGDPLVVAIPVAYGTLIHAVPHWRQPADVACTALEARRLASIPAYRNIVPHGPCDLTLGSFWAAQAMLGALARGLQQALPDLVTAPERLASREAGA